LEIKTGLLTFIVSSPIYPVNLFRTGGESGSRSPFALGLSAFSAGFSAGPAVFMLMLGAVAGLQPVHPVSLSV
jgi:hypothetical protein